MTTWQRERARYASLTRSRPADDPELLEARRKIAAIRLEDAVRAVVVDQGVALTPEEQERIVALIRG